MITPERIDELRGEYDHCFACGTANPIGLHLGGFRVDGEAVIAEWLPGRQFRGFESTLHGGIIATALDEILAWAGIYFEGVLAVTVKLDLKYRSPAPPDVPFVLSGRVDGRSGSRLRMSGELRSDAGLHATAAGIYLVHKEVS